MTKAVLVLFLFTMAAGAQSADPSALDQRLSVHTLLREDIFAGVLTNDAERLTRAEKNIEVLLVQRPADRPPLLAWKGDIALYRSVIAYEAKREDEFDRQYKRALDLFAEAKRARPDGGGVLAIIGGDLLYFGTRLPERYRAAAFSESYACYSGLFKQQAASLDTLPLHLKGELLSGLAESAYRSNHVAEYSQYLEQILVALPNTPYAARAAKWKQNPAIASRGAMNCQTCHEEGQLAVRIAALGKN
jgi:hypothetical protein